MLVNYFNGSVFKRLKINQFFRSFDTENLNEVTWYNSSYLGNRFSIKHLTNLSIEHEDDDFNDVDSVDEGETTEDIINNLRWYDTEQDDDGQEQEQLDEEDEDNEEEIGFLNLDPGALGFELVEQTLQLDQELEKQKSIFDADPHKPFDSTIFSLSPGEFISFADTAPETDYTLDEFINDPLFPEIEEYDYDIDTDNLEVEIIDYAEFIGLGIEDPDEGDEVHTEYWEDDQALAYWLKIQQWANIFPSKEFIFSSLQSTFFRKTTFLKYKYLGFGSLTTRNTALMWRYSPFTKVHYFPHGSQPRVFFEAYLTYELESYQEEVVVDESRVLYSPTPPEIVDTEAVRTRKFKDADWYNRHSPRPFNKDKPLNRQATLHLMPEEEENEENEEDFFASQLPPEYFKNIKKYGLEVAVVTAWRNSLLEYAGDIHQDETRLRYQEKIFKRAKWRFDYQFNRYYVQKTLTWYLHYYTSIPFKETIEQNVSDNLLVLDTMFFKKWRDGDFLDFSLFHTLSHVGEWLDYFLSVMLRQIPKHPFHIVTPSPWPLLASFGALLVTTGGVLYMHSYIFGGFTLFLGIIYLISILTLWWRDVIREASFLGNHTPAVQTNLKIGIALFIVSEVMFFFAFFWAFFHSSLSPAIDVGSVWPPLGITPISPYGIPLFNSFVLALSGYTVTYAHHAMLEGDRKLVFNGLVFTLILAFLFSALQFIEYRSLPFLLSDGIYGSTFFMTTGFHALHVIIGSTFLLVCLFRLNQFTKTHHIGFEGAIWYWHFVDVVWLFLWLSIYWWPSLQ